MTKGIYPLEGVIQDYAWGGFDFIPDLLSLNNRNRSPHAELWLGTHPKGTSSIIINKNKDNLAEAIQKNPTAYLGEKTAQRFDSQLPFLFKVLDVRKMLSIQAHPTKPQAETGFADENKSNTPILAPHRVFRDDNHKPEIMVALSDFWLLHGFKTTEGIQKMLSIPEFSVLRPFYNNSTYDLYKYIMELPQKTVDKILSPLYQRLKPLQDAGQLSRDTADYWAAMAFEDYTQDGHYDSGIFSIYLFNLVHLKSGEGIFQAAGIPHAYLEGQNIELMANSDNVFRGGLTVKHIDIAKLLAHLDFSGIQAVILKGKPITPIEKVYPAPVEDFKLNCIRLSSTQKYISKALFPEIWIITNGNCCISTNNIMQNAQKGAAFWVFPNTSYEITTTEEVIIYKATGNLK